MLHTIGHSYLHHFHFCCYVLFRLQLQTISNEGNEYLGTNSIFIWKNKSTISNLVANKAILEERLHEATIGVNEEKVIGRNLE